VSSPNEELGSEGFIDFFKTLSKDSFLVLGFEPSLDNGSIIAKRRGNLWYDIETTGLEAHSGRAHKDGINAALELCLKLTEIQKLNDYEKDTTINIGHIEGGKDKYNVVCGWANAKLEARFPSWEEHKRLKTKIEKVLNKNILSTQDGKKSAQTKFKITNDCPPLSPISKTKQYLESYLKCVQKFEKRKIAVEQAGGAADTNYFSRPNLCLIDGLGASGGGMHTKNEFVVISSLETRSQALAEFLGSSF
jgi:glutamate carboxypeptidase